MILRFDPLVAQDIGGIVEYYESESGSVLAARFMDELESTVRKIKNGPQIYKSDSNGIRRAELISFPYHFLFESANGITTIFVLRHNRRHPRYGFGRR